MNPFVLQHPARIETLFVIPDGFLFILKAGHDVNSSFTSLLFFPFSLRNRVSSLLRFKPDTESCWNIYI